MFVVAVAKCLPAMSGEARFRSQFQRHFHLRHGPEAPGSRSLWGKLPTCWWTKHTSSEHFSKAGPASYRRQSLQDGDISWIQNMRLLRTFWIVLPARLALDPQHVVKRSDKTLAGAGNSLWSVWLLSVFKFYLLYFVCVSVLLICMSVHHLHLWYPERAEERVRSPDNGFRDSYEPPCRCLELNPGPLLE